MTGEVLLTPEGDELGVVLWGGELASLLAAADPKSDASEVHLKLVAGAGFEPATFGL